MQEMDYKSFRVVNGRLMWRKVHSQRLACQDCAGDRSIGSAKFCRKCYRARTAKGISQAAPPLLDRERGLPSQRRPIVVHRNSEEPINVTSLLAGRFLR